MGRAKSKGAKFAAVKKIISKKTIKKYKDDVRDPRRRDAEKEKLGRNVDVLCIEGCIKSMGYKDGLKKTEQAITSVATEIQSLVQDTKTRSKGGQNFHRFLTKASKECEGSLKTEDTKFEATHDKFCKEKAAHVQNLKALLSCISKWISGLSELEKTVSDINGMDTLSLKKIKQLKQCLGELKNSGKEKATLSELEKTAADDKAGVSLKKLKQGDKSISMIRKSFASVLGPHDKD